MMSAPYGAWLAACICSWLRPSRVATPRTRQAPASRGPARAGAAGGHEAAAPAGAGWFAAADALVVPLG